MVEARSHVSDDEVKRRAVIESPRSAGRRRTQHEDAALVTGMCRVGRAVEHQKRAFQPPGSFIPYVSIDPIGDRGSPVDARAGRILAFGKVEKNGGRLGRVDRDTEKTAFSLAVDGDVQDRIRQNGSAEHPADATRGFLQNEHVPGRQEIDGRRAVDSVGDGSDGQIRIEHALRRGEGGRATCDGCGRDSKQALQSHRCLPVPSAADRPAGVRIYGFRISRNSAVSDGFPVRASTPQEFQVRVSRVATLIGLTGGIGAGKSTVAAMLAERGAVVVDADRIAHDIYAPGTEGFDLVVARFGRGIIGETGAIDRAELGQVVFGDREALEDLNRIVHPLVRSEVARRVAGAFEESEDAVVVVEAALMTETGWTGGAGELWAVIADPEVVTPRLVSDRGMDPTEIRMRMAAQTDNDKRREIATRVIENHGSIDDLEAQVEAAFSDMLAATASSSSPE